MQIERIEIKNYRCFHSIVLNDLPSLSVIVAQPGPGSRLSSTCSRF